jgi:membrane-associated protein
MDFPILLIGKFFDFIIHIDTHLGEIINSFGGISYAILFFIIFAETGFVFTPFLPGDSLLFAAGAFAALGFFNIFFLLTILWMAAFLGDTANYWIGHFFGQKIINNPKIPLINQKHIEETQLFYQKHGGKTIFLARFIPIIRTFAPFVAGVGKMEYKKFIVFNASGGLAWIFLFTLTGYFFGNLPQVKRNFSLVVLAIILISITPIIIEILKNQFKKLRKLKNN